VWLYSNLRLLQHTQDLQQLGQAWMAVEEEEEEEMGQEESSSGKTGSRAMRTMQSRIWGTTCWNF